MMVNSDQTKAPAVLKCSCPIHWAYVLDKPRSSAMGMGTSGDYSQKIIPKPHLVY
jgi:hypothetical protein